MTEYRVKWCQCPHVRHTSQVLFVEAESTEAAHAIAKDHIQRTYHIGWFSIFGVDPYTRPTGGRVVPSTEN